MEFGYKAQLVDNADGIVLDHSVVIGNPPDAPMLVPTIERVGALFGRIPRAVTADRGYGEATVETALESMGVKTVAIPRKGRPKADRRLRESSRRFRTLVKWRTGSEGRIAHLKRSWGWERTVLDGIDGAITWCGWGVLAHNATKIAALSEKRETKNASTGSTRTCQPTATGPPCRHPPPPKNPAA